MCVSFFFVFVLLRKTKKKETKFQKGEKNWGGKKANKKFFIVFNETSVISFINETEVLR